MNTSLLMPIAVLQGFWVMQRTPRLPTPTGYSGRYGLGLGKPLRVIGVGDSAIAGTGVTEQCDSVTAVYARKLHERLNRDVEWRIHGYSGATSAAVLHRLLPAAPPAQVYLVSAGVNDVIKGVAPAKYGDNLTGIFQALRRKSADATVIFGGLPPLECFPALPWPLRAVLAERVRVLQGVAMDIAARDERTFVFRFPPTMPADQFARDGFHPGERACERWATGLLDLWPPAAWAPGRDGAMDTLRRWRESRRGRPAALRRPAPRRSVSAGHEPPSPRA